MNIILATNNKHKIREISDILNFQRNRILTLSDIKFTEPMIENGHTYYDNARIKAQAVYNKIKDSVILADDSGLEIDYFNGAPGIHSARFMEGLTQFDKNREIVKKMSNLPVEKRAARFISVVCCILPEGESHFFKGICSGHIASDNIGDNGFGFDPIFIPTGFNATFGALSEDVKNTISHRALSFLEAKSFIVMSGILD